jgi:hypothetical protein
MLAHKVSQYYNLTTHAAVDNGEGRVVARKIGPLVWPQVSAGGAKYWDPVSSLLASCSCMPLEVSTRD